MSEVIIKNNEFCRVSLNEKEGYIIRLNDYPGATFTITKDGDIRVGQSSRMSYSVDAWKHLQQEISEGCQYMSRVIMLGTWGNTFKSIGQGHILPRNYVPGAVYKDYKDRIILWLGEGYLVKGGCFGQNRQGCKYLCAIAGTGFQLQDIQVQGDTCYITASYPAGYYFDFSVDSRATKPSKLVECIYKPRNYFHQLVLNGKFHAAWSDTPVQKGGIMRI